MTPDDQLKTTLIARETEVWEALVRGDASADAEALAEEFLGVYPDGFSGKGAHVGQLTGGPTVTAYRLSDHRTMRLGPDTALLAYRADYTRTAGTRSEAMYVTSIWQSREGRWINIFSQDTPAAEDGAPKVP